MTTAKASLHPGRTLTRHELRDIAARYADDARAGVYSAQFDGDERWHVRIHQDDDVDVWLISWTHEQGTELHDHGGSSGVFTVVEGVLTEYAWSGPRSSDAGMLVTQERSEGDTITFGPTYVHDVRNHRPRPAVSVHAFSPPISRMNYYEPVEGNLLLWASTWTDDPEAPTPERHAS